MLRHLLLAMVLLPASFAVARAQDGWLLFRGNPQRTGEASNLPAWQKRVAWQRPLLMDKYPLGDGTFDIDEDKAVKTLITRLRKDADPSILPAFFPLIVGEMCVYRSYRDVRSVALQDFGIKYEQREARFHPGEIIWKSMDFDGSISVLANRNDTKPWLAHVENLLKERRQDHFLWANATIGSISADGKTVFIVDDIVVPTKEENRFAPEVRAIEQYSKGSSLEVFDVRSGKLSWQSVYRDFRVFKGELGETFFLGAPLAHAGKLFALNERGGNLRLVRISLDHKKWKSVGIANSDAILSIMNVPIADQIVAKHVTKAGKEIRSNVVRRTQPLHIASSGDLLVCPTHAGVVVGVDRAKMAVRWTYRYRAEKTPPPDLPLWQAACPVIFKDRIVFTAADAPDVHCVDFHGKKQWAARTDKDLYLATVVDDIVLLVGKTHCRALKLSDGKEKWRLETGLPAGVGVRAGSIYYLPLKRGDGPTIWAIDLVKGQKSRALKMPFPDALGNLILHRGMFVSQSVTHIAAFPLPAIKP